MSEKEIVTMDGVDYTVADLTDEGKALVESLKFVEQELVQMQARLAVLNTAKTAYAASLRNQLITNKH
jgi:DNA repair ATPase RecN